MREIRVGDYVEFDPDETWNCNNKIVLAAVGCVFGKAYEVTEISNYGSIVIFNPDTEKKTGWNKHRFKLPTNFNIDDFEVRAWSRYAKAHLLT